MKRMMKTFNLAALTAGAVAYLTATTDAAAQPARNCGPRAVVVERLADGYGETRRSIALGADNTMVEIFASAETGSWTLTVTRPGGATCLVASGQAYETVVEALPAKGNDA